MILAWASPFNITHYCAQLAHTGRVNYRKQKSVNVTNNVSRMLDRNVHWCVFISFFCEIQIYVYSLIVKLKL